MDACTPGQAQRPNTTAESAATAAAGNTPGRGASLARVPGRVAGAPCSLAMPIPRLEDDVPNVRPMQPSGAATPNKATRTAWDEPH